MKKATIALKRLILLAGVIVISILFLVAIVSIIVPSIERSVEARVSYIAHTLAYYMSALSTVEKGIVKKDLEGTYEIEVGKKSENTYWVKVSQIKNGKTMESKKITFFGNVMLRNKFETDVVYLKKEPGKPVHIGPSKFIDYCKEPNPQEIKDSIKAHGRKNVEEALIKALMAKGSKFKHCEGNQVFVDPFTRGIGIMKIDPITANVLGVAADNYDDNIRGGIELLSQMLDKYRETELALAAYRAGGERVDGWRDCINKDDASWGEIISNNKIVVTKMPDKDNNCHMSEDVRWFVPSVIRCKGCYENKPDCYNFNCCEGGCS